MREKVLQIFRERLKFFDSQQEREFLLWLDFAIYNEPKTQEFLEWYYNYWSVKPKEEVFLHWRGLLNLIYNEHFPHLLDKYIKTKEVEKYLIIKEIEK